MQGRLRAVEGECLVMWPSGLRVLRVVEGLQTLGQLLWVVLPRSPHQLQLCRVPEPEVRRGVVGGFGSERTTDALGDERRRGDEANLRARHRRDEGERGRVRDFQGNDIDRSSGGAFSLSR